MLEVINVEALGDKAVVKIAGSSLEEVKNTEARKLAIAAATRHISKCGLDGYGDFAYQNPPTTPGGEWVELTESEMRTPGVRKPGGRYVIDVKLNSNI